MNKAKKEIQNAKIEAQETMDKAQATIGNA